MRTWVSRIILCLSALVVAAPADFCMLKLAGMCCVAKASPECCCEKCTRRANDGSKECSHTERNNCCAYTPADGIVTHAQVPACDIHCDLPPVTMFDFSAQWLTLMPAACVDSSTPIQFHSPAPPLFLRVHSFLI